MDRDVRDAIYSYLASRKPEDLEVLRRLMGGEPRDLSPVGLAIEYISRGGDPERISTLLSWRDFEEFVSTSMELAGMETVRGIRAPPPRGFEIDVLGVEPISGFSIAVDCKHWSRVRNLSRAARDMEERVSRALSRCTILLSHLPTFYRARHLYPLIVTLREPQIRYIGRVLIAPIHRFRDLLLRLREYAEELGIEPYDNPCYKLQTLS
ncbi:MAG: hypothetical protein QXQ57_01660 [Sulfolobales archaeon]